MNKSNTQELNESKTQLESQDRRREEYRPAPQSAGSMGKSIYVRTELEIGGDKKGRQDKKDVGDSYMKPSKSSSSSRTSV
ncbi:hypothetical protein NEOLI_005253 [Neolecta irregularis DAH-3]|uniref:Uncharacterized protein n=1 Tax=Neolecta irregularis (strain DAH-3) TaxID=1198029 RepID=A0A1U7LJZ8_NEOID|nr:hypothetical protein NEOLI_005253 [Neolecta irregularis DAH-3]|eukprot:OLL22986.1 hypothetical protein NEOLI_005253 [Neolecta irregularis DAH-3]